MSGSSSYWLSPQRGLPAPTGGLGRGIEPRMLGVLEEPWKEETGHGSFPPPLYLQTRAQSMAQVQKEARVQRFLQQTRERSQLAFGPGAATASPQAGGLAPPMTAGYQAALPPEQLYGSGPAVASTPSQTGSGTGDNSSVMRPGLRQAFDPPVEEEYTASEPGAAETPSAQGFRRTGLGTNYTKEDFDRLLASKGQAQVPGEASARVPAGGPVHGLPLWAQGASTSTELQRQIRADMASAVQRGWGGSGYFQQQARRDYIQQMGTGQTAYGLL